MASPPMRADAALRTEERLREIDYQFHGAADTAPVMIWRSDVGKLCTWFNQRWLEFVGRPMEREVGNGWTDNVHPDDRDGCMHTYTTAFDSRQAFSIEYRLRRHDGEYRWLSDDGIPLYDQDGAFTGYIGFCIDITPRKQAEQALRDSNRHKDEFLAILAHELRNPLAAIRNATEILLRSSNDSRTVRTAADILDRQVNHLVRQVDDLLDVSRISRGKVELRVARVDLKSIVRHAVESIQPLADSQAHELAVSVPPDPLYVLGDPVRLTQVLSNLLNNACKFTDRGGRIALTVARDGEQVVIRVADTGIGIPAGDLKRIFELFAQADRSGVRARDGLGLGLSVVKNLVELHDGTVEARSAGAGHGSEFVVRLPLVEQRREPVQAMPLPARGEARRHPTEIGGP